MKEREKALCVAGCAVLATVALVSLALTRIGDGGDSVAENADPTKIPLRKDRPECGTAERALGPATVVSGLWAIRSKRGLDTYLAWAKNFLAMDSHMVLFVDPELRERLEALRPQHLRSRTTWISLNISQFWTAKYRPIFAKQWPSDPEKGHHSVELYMVWAEKLALLRRAITLNPFRSKCFYWTDFGCFRDDTMTRYLHWPGVDECFADPRVVVLKIREFSNQEIDGFRSKNVLASVFTGVTVGGGIYGGRWDHVERFHEEYFATLEAWAKRGLFVGKDQTLLASVALTRPDIARTVGPNSENPWFYLEDLLLPCDSPSFSTVAHKPGI